MKTYRVVYRLAPSVEGTRDLLVVAPDARGATEKAQAVLKLRYPHHQITGVFPGLSFDSDPVELYRRPATSGRCVRA